MNNIGSVYHGTSEYKGWSNPQIHKRIKKNKSGNRKVIFDELSFHASSLKWIALAYTYSYKTFLLNKEEFYYNISVDLYSKIKQIEIHGINSLEKSLEALYGNGGYILEFSSNDFFHKQGLGYMEVITKKVFKPISIIKIDDVVIKLIKENVTFSFIDLSLEKNKHLRNHKQ